MRDFIQIFLLCVEAFFILYMILYSSFLFLSVTVGSSDLYAAKRRNRLKNELANDYYVPVSVLVPAHNEEVTIEATVRSLLALDYKLYEIVVVDDGSTDNTTQVMRDAFQMWKIERPIQRRIPCQPEEEIYETRAYKVPITLVRKKNGGKADALNMGINVSNYPYFLCLDADSVLQHDSLEKIVRPVLEDSSVVAVGGTVDRQIFFLSMPTLAEKAALMACWTISSGITFQASRAVALALWAPSIWAIPPQAIIFLDSQASTKERIMLILR